jgi:ABC-type uncharacterized transport system permease subunit
LTLYAPFPGSRSPTRSLAVVVHVVALVCGAPHLSGPLQARGGEDLYLIVIVLKVVVVFFAVIVLLLASHGGGCKVLFVVVILNAMIWV